MANDSGLDLVEVNPLANPPVAKILNLGQFKYEQDKKAHRQKVQQKKVELKSIRLTFRISAHDLAIRQSQAIKFLQKDNKVKIDLLLRGREKQHFDRAREMMLEFTGGIKAAEGLVVEDDNPLTRQPSGFTITLISKK
jgi:translation initiation factor IF-3